MSRPIILHSLQWADVPLERLLGNLSEWGYDGVELACRGDHFEVDKALSSDAYVRAKRELLEKYKLRCLALSDHLTSTCVCDDPIDELHKRVVPSRIWGDGKPEGVRGRAAEEMKNIAHAAKLLGVNVVVGLSGSSIWRNWYPFASVSQAYVDAGYKDFANRWLPILDVYQSEGVKYALEAHPTSIAYDIITAKHALEAVRHHPSFGYNCDPSHIIHQFVNPVFFIEEFADRIFHVHIKDARIQLNGRNSILCSHLNFGDPRRGWDFITPGRGDVKWDPFLRALDRINYTGPLSVEWEDPGVDRDFGAREALTMLRKVVFTRSDRLPDYTFKEISK